MDQLISHLSGWLLFSGAFFLITFRALWKKIPLAVFAPIRAIAISNLFTPAIFGGSIGALPMPASFLAYLLALEKIHGSNSTELLAENLKQILPLWILVTIATLAVILYREQKRKVEPDGTGQPM